MSLYQESLEIADKEGYRITTDGFKSLVSILDHLANGGTVDNHMVWSKGEITAIFAVATLSVGDSLIDRADTI